MIQVDDSFWNIRGSFRIAGLLDVGTQASLYRRPGGKFVLLDAYTFDEETADEIAELTFGGSAIEAILNLHPFHTVHVETLHTCFPDAVLVGTRRHKQKLPHLPWEDLTVDQPEVHEHFSEELDFSVPRGVAFIPDNEMVHFSSVLAYHKPSKTIHVDDTFNYVPKRGLIGFTPLADTLSFHPTLGKALEPRPGAAEAFRGWARQLMEDWGDAENLCAAHTGALLAAENAGDSIRDRMQAALDKVRDTLSGHENKYG